MVATIDASFLQNLSILAADESLMQKLKKYMNRLLAESKDETLFTKEEYFHRLDEAERGATYKMLPNETMDEMLVRLGYV